MGNFLGAEPVPQDAIAAYTNFLRSYGLLHTEMLDSDAIESATRLWCTLSAEQRSGYAQMDTSRPKISECVIYSECVQPRSAALAKKATKKAKAKIKAKKAATKLRRAVQALPVASKRVKKSVAKKRKTAKRGVKPVASRFWKFYEELLDRHGEISESEIIKKAAKAWCNMNSRQRQRFLQ